MNKLKHRLIIIELFRGVLQKFHQFLFHNKQKMRLLLCLFLVLSFSECGLLFQHYRPKIFARNNDQPQPQPQPQPQQFSQTRNHQAILNKLPFFDGSNGNVIVGDNNRLRGDNVNIIGDENGVIGGDSNVIGDGNVHLGFDSNIVGSDNKIVGVGHNIYGNGIKMFGTEAHPQFYNYISEDDKPNSQGHKWQHYNW